MRQFSHVCELVFNFRSPELFSLSSFYNEKVMVSITIVATSSCSMVSQNEKIRERKRTGLLVQPMCGLFFCNPLMDWFDLFQYTFSILNNHKMFLFKRTIAKSVRARYPNKMR